MVLEHIQKRIAFLIPWGSAVTSVFVMTGAISDPVNVTKLLVAGAVAGALLLVLVPRGLNEIRKNHPLFTLTIGLFVLFAFSASVFSSSPWVQNIYGVYGRNTGLLTYVVLSVFALASTLLSNEKQLTRLLVAFFSVGVINLTYGLWALLFGDFMAWNNTYGNLLGFFGNPNFMGAFLGMLFALILTYSIAPQTGLKFRILGVALLLITSLEIVKTHAVQGVVVSAGSVLICGFFWTWYRFRNKILSASYILISALAGLVAAAGALQIGPLTEIVYKRSVSLRGIYWNAGIDMGLNHPFTGVGMDGFGNWYRRVRALKALSDPGAEVTSNAAHNVVIDFFAYGGFPLVLAYLAIMGIGLISIIRIGRRQNRYNPLFIGLSVVWICYQTQSIISINQIGLAIWGWVFTGGLVAYERITRSNTLEAKNSKAVVANKQVNSFDSTGLRAFLGLIIGALIAIPPFTADLTFQTSLNARSADSMAKSLESNYFKPSDSYRLANAVQIFDKSNLPEKALKFARQGVLFNPNFTDAWKMLYYVTGSTAEDKAKAKAELIRLDPLNPEWKELP
jgi:O-antigen ligase